MPVDRHASPSAGQQELLYDADVPTPSHAERARTLVALEGTGTLATLAREPAGTPYASFVTFALTESGAPVFLISNLAEHTQNLYGDERCSLLVAEGGGGDPLARGRVTLVGRCARVEDDGERHEARGAFLTAHPNASDYVDFDDFAFWRLETAGIRYIGGFGRMSWVDVGDWSSARPDPLARHAAGIMEHMNEDHGAAMVAYCKAFTRATDTESATMTGVDRYGFEMSAITGAGPRPIRLPFAKVATTPEAARTELVALVEAARAKLG